MAFKDKKVEDFQVRRHGPRYEAHDPRNYHDIAIRIRRICDENIDEALKLLKLGQDPRRFMGETEYYAIVSIEDKAVELKGSTIEDVKFQILNLLKDGPVCDWSDNILVEVKWVLGKEEVSEDISYFIDRGKSWRHDSLQYSLIRKAETPLGTCWAKGGKNTVTIAPKIGKSNGYNVSENHQKEHDVKAIIPDTPGNRKVIENICEMSRIFHRDIGQILLAGEHVWNTFAQRVLDGENITQAAHDVSSGIIDTSKENSQEN